MVGADADKAMSRLWLLRHADLRLTLVNADNGRQLHAKLDERGGSDSERGGKYSRRMQLHIVCSSV